MTEEKYVMCKPTMKNAIEAKCHDCMGHYFDGKIDCKNSACPLYAWMPYKKSKPSSDWRKYYSRRSGLKLRLPPTPEQIERGRKLAAGMAGEANDE